MKGHVEDRTDFRIHCHALSHADTVASINLQTVFLDCDVFLQSTLGSVQASHCFLGRLKFIFQELERITDLFNFTDQTLKINKIVSAYVVNNGHTLRALCRQTGIAHNFPSAIL